MQEWSQEILKTDCVINLATAKFHGSRRVCQVGRWLGKLEVMPADPLT
jgi:hypothetical protein